MFAKNARTLNFSRSHFSQGRFSKDLALRRNAAAVRPSHDDRTNDNRPVRLVAPRRRERRPVLFCRWHVTRAGRLECSWHDGSGPATEAPGISCSAAALHRSNCLAIAQRRRGQRGPKTTPCRQSARSALTDSLGPHSIHGVQVCRLI